MDSDHQDTTSDIPLIRVMVMVVLRVLVNIVFRVCPSFLKIARVKRETCNLILLALRSYPHNGLYDKDKRDYESHNRDDLTRGTK